LRITASAALSASVNRRSVRLSLDVESATVISWHDLAASMAAATIASKIRCLRLLYGHVTLWTRVYTLPYSGALARPAAAILPGNVLTSQSQARFGSHAAPEPATSISSLDWPHLDLQFHFLLEPILSP